MLDLFLAAFVNLITKILFLAKRGHSQGLQFDLLLLLLLFV